MNHYEEIPIWENAVVPFTQENDAEKIEHYLDDPKDGIDRKTDVTVPTITYYPVSGKGPHPAVVVCPGGGYGILAWNHEGIDICSWLNTIGFSAFLLKYRVPDNRPAAHADAARAIRYIRANAEKFNIRADQLGIMGFSAGGHLTASVTAPAGDIPYPPQNEEIDSIPFRPDFSLLIYPAYLIKNDQLNLAPEFKITAQTPPTFIVQAENDGIKVENALAWYWEMKKAGAPAEMHCYATGGHGYGLLRTGQPIAEWPSLAAVWLRGITGMK